MAVIALEGIKLFAHHGLHEAEQREGNHFVVDVYVTSPISAAADTDRIELTIDYERVYGVVNSAFSERVNLLESLVSRIGLALRKMYPEAGSVRVRVSKLDPPVGGEVFRAFVEDEY